MSGVVMFVRLGLFSELNEFFRYHPRTGQARVEGAESNLWADGHTTQDPDF